jgi:hypothetical protein
VRETAVHHTPFCTRLHLEKDIAGAQPQVLLVAPMSGHFATLLRGTAQTILADHDVYISDWRNARDIGLRHGEFGFDEFIDHVTTFLQVLGPGVHVVGVCQPCSLATRHRRLPGGGRVIPSREDGEQLCYSTIFTFAQLPERNREFGRFDCVLRALARRGSEHFGSVVGDV